MSAAEVSDAGAPPPPRAKRTSLKKGALLNWLSLAVHFVATFVVTPIIIRTLGNAGFGTWALIQSFSGYYGLVNLGLGSALLRSITHDLATQRLDSLQTTVSTAVRFFALTGGGIVLLGAALCVPAAGFFGVADAEVATFSVTLLLAAGSVVLDFFGSVTTSVVNACERFDLLNYLNIGRQLAQTGGTLLVLWIQPSITGIAAVIFLVSLGALLLGIGFTRRLLPEISLAKPGFDRGRLRELLAYGRSTVLLTVSNVVRLRLGNVIIAKFAGVAAVAGYSVAVSLVTNFSTVISSSLGVLNARFTRLHAKAEHAELAKLYRSALFASSAMACGLGTGMILFGEKFIHLWIGKTLPEAVPVLQALVLAYILALAQSPGWNLMFALSKHHFMARIAAVESAANIALGVWLAARYGAVGFAWATAATMILTKVTVQPVYSARIGGLSTASYLAPMAAPFAAAAALAAVWYGAGLHTAILRGGPGTFVLAGAGYALAFGLLVLLPNLNRDFMPPFVGKVLRRLKLRR